MVGKSKTVLKKSGKRKPTQKKQKPPRKKGTYLVGSSSSDSDTSFGDLTADEDCAAAYSSRGASGHARKVREHSQMTSTKKGRQVSTLIRFFGPKCLESKMFNCF